MSDLMALDKEFIANTYGRFNVALVRGEGSVVYDEEGKKYIDLGTGIAVNSFGIGDEEWKKAVIEQLDCIQHTSNLYYSVPQVKLAELLCERTGMSKVFFSNSGAEANECAIKVARKYSSDKYGDDRNIIITLINSFHGRTVTTLSATGQDVFHKSFGPFTPGFVYAKANDIDDMNRLLSENEGKVCGIMMELVQGEGGVNALEKDYVSAVAAICKEKDICLIIDEVQTGNGRTGALYAFQNFDIEPDIVSTAKGLAGGLPFGATMMGEKTANVLGGGDHGSTFGGNPVCAAGAYSIISRIDDELLSDVNYKSELIKNFLADVPGVKSISGMGLMLGIEVEGDAKQIVKDGIEAGVICLTAKTKVRLLPALNIPEKTLIEALEILKEVIIKNTQNK